MSKYKLLLDESGSFDNKDEKYVIIGGVLFKEEYQLILLKVRKNLKNRFEIIFNFNIFIIINSNSINYC